MTEISEQLSEKINAQLAKMDSHALVNVLLSGNEVWSAMARIEIDKRKSANSK